MSRLHRLRLEDYRSIKICNLSLGPLTLLISPNRFEKSDVLDALKFTSQTLGKNSSNAFRERDDIAEARRRSAGHPMHFVIAMTFVMSAGRRAGEYESEIGAAKGGEYRAPQEMCRIRSDEFGLEDRSFETRVGQLMSSPEERLPRIFLDRLLLVTLSGQEPFRRLSDGLTSMEVFNPAPEAMQVIQRLDPGDLLRRNVSNIASVIERPGRTDLSAKAGIREYLSHIMPGVKAIQRADMANWETLKFQQKVQGTADLWFLQASSISDGTLRTLGVLVALSAGTGEVVSPVGIEKPEPALHPAALGLLLDAIRNVSQRRQIPVTSHSPGLFDSPSIVIDELLAMRSVSGIAIVDRLDATMQVVLKEPLFTAGELVRVDQPQSETDDVA